MQLGPGFELIAKPKAFGAKAKPNNTGVVWWTFCRVLQIFTEDLDEVRSLPRENVLNFIEKADETLVVAYLVSDMSVVLSIVDV